MAHAQIHRYGNRVAVFIGKGETQYLTSAEAAKLAKALNRAVKSCRTETFQKSTCGTFEMEFNGSIHQAD